MYVINCTPAYVVPLLVEIFTVGVMMKTFEAWEYELLGKIVCWHLINNLKLAEKVTQCFYIGLVLHLISLPGGSKHYSVTNLMRNSYIPKQEMKSWASWTLAFPGKSRRHSKGLQLSQVSEYFWGNTHQIGTLILVCWLNAALRMVPGLDGRAFAFLATLQVHLTSCLEENLSCQTLWHPIWKCPELLSGIYQVSMFRFAVLYLIAIKYWFSLAIFNHCAVAHLCAVDCLQVCLGTLESISYL